MMDASASRRPLRHRAGPLLCAAALALALLGTTARCPDRAAAATFPPLDSSAIHAGKLFDLGVADYNDDGILDVFTTNHKFDSTLLAGVGDGSFRDAFVPAGLSPTQAFPGYEYLRRAPNTSAPGLYLYATDRDQPRDPFHIQTTAIAASGRLVFEAQQLNVESSSGASVTTSRRPDGSTELDFDADPGASIDVTVEHIDLPVTVSIDPPTDPSQIRVGADSVAATSRDLTLSLRDRHGFGFADFDGDRSTDLFISTGGLGGEILDPFFTGRQSDELLLSRPGGYLTATAASGLTKGTCRGRQANVADINGDGGLDIFESCDEATPQVYLGNGMGRFQQVPGPPAPGSAYRLVDLAGGRRPEVVAANGPLVQVWRSNGEGAWSLAQQIRTLNGERPITHIALGDYDGDGSLDIFAVSPGGNTLLKAVGGKLRRRAPRKLGLPNRGSFAASFVDYDNDGALDLYLVPQGLYAGDDRSFKRTGRLRSGPLPTGPIGYAIASWADLDGDGRRDLLSDRGRGEFSTIQAPELHHNSSRSGHWLEVDLAGPYGNVQAIGAEVRVRTADGWLRQWVGQNDDSLYGSGHYRLYFGLGDQRRIRKLVIRWPRGERQTRRTIRADRLLRVPYAPDGS